MPLSLPRMADVPLPPGVEVGNAAGTGVTSPPSSSSQQQQQQQQGIFQHHQLHLQQQVGPRVLRGRERQDMEVEENEGNGGKLEIVNDDEEEGEEDEDEVEVMRVRKLPRNKSDFFVRRALVDESDVRRVRYGGGGGGGSGYGNGGGRNGLKPCKCLKPNGNDGQGGKSRPHKMPSPSFF